jgi:hypothetical protein
LKNINVETIIGDFWASLIEKINIDVCDHKIFLDLASYNDGKEWIKHQIIFEGVTAFFFVNGLNEKRFITQTWENAEISEFHYFENPEDQISYCSGKSGIPKYEANINFYIEIWSSLFLIEAKTIIIDGVRYLS